MSSFHDCPKCGRLIWTGKETCGCIPHEYRLKSWGDEYWETTYSRLDGESLAAELAREDWSRDPSDPHKYEETVYLRDGRGCVAEFNITAEATVDFTAREVRK